jgi:transcriptional regulator with XRE-family HTH domain
MMIAKEKTVQEANELEAFGQRLRYLMFLNNWNRGQLAETLGTSRGCISNWLSGRVAPHRLTLVNISERTGRSVKWLLGYLPLHDEQANVKVCHRG